MSSGREDHFEVSRSLKQVDEDELRDVPEDKNKRSSLRNKWTDAIRKTTDEAAAAAMEQNLTVAISSIEALQTQLFDSNRRIEELAHAKAACVLEVKEYQARVLELENHEQSLIDHYEAELHAAQEEMTMVKDNVSMITTSKQEEDQETQENQETQKKTEEELKRNKLQLTKALECLTVSRTTNLELKASLVNLKEVCTTEFNATTTLVTKFEKFQQHQMLSSIQNHREIRTLAAAKTQLEKVQKELLEEKSQKSENQVEFTKVLKEQKDHIRALQRSQEETRNHVDRLGASRAGMANEMTSQRKGHSKLQSSSQQLMNTVRNKDRTIYDLKQKLELLHHIRARELESSFRTVNRVLRQSKCQNNMDEIRNTIDACDLRQINDLMEVYRDESSYHTKSIAEKLQAAVIRNDELQNQKKVLELENQMALDKVFQIAPHFGHDNNQS